MIKQESQAYFKALGAHIAALRKSRGMTQAELARAIGVSQQAVFSYELGDRRVSALILTKMARVFSISMDVMAGAPTAMPGIERRVSPRALRHAERIQGLSKTEQRFLIRILDAIEESRER